MCFPIQVATCTQIISPNTEDAKYVVDIKKIGKVNNIPTLWLLHDQFCVVEPFVVRFIADISFAS
jgi:hypothetical protein